MNLPFAFLALSCSLLAIAAPPSQGAVKEPVPNRNIGGPGDYALREKLVHQVGVDPDLARQPLKIILVNGGVVFSGEVTNCALEHRALIVAASLRGVINVTDQMTIARAGLTDEAIRKTVSGILQGAKEVLGLKDFDVGVQDSVATLNGVVADFRARVRAEEMAGTILGLTRISNHLRPADAPSGTDDATLLKAVIRYLGDTQQFPYGGEIGVKAEQGMITLRGSVPLCLARQQALVMATLVGGVKKVDCRLKVDPSLQMPRAMVKALP